MSARILVFPGADPGAAGGTALTAQWANQHLPLIDAAMDLLKANDDEFTRRCRLIAETEGPAVLEQLTAQLDRLGSHVGEVMKALAMTAMRIRTTMALKGTSA